MKSTGLFNGGLVAAAGLLLTVSGLANGLPQDHEYQRVLRAWMAGLRADDLRVERLPFRPLEEPRPPVEMHRLWTLTLLVPPFDVGLPPEPFLLENIETDDGVVLPNLSCSATAWLTAWDDPINPYFGNRALKRRALVWAAADMIMLDQVHAAGQARRSDYLGGTLIWTAYALYAAGDALPQDARAAYEQGLRRMVDKLRTWGPTGSMTDMDLFAPVGLWYAAEALDDPEVRRFAEAYSRPLFTDPRFFHPAGYFVDVGAYDVSYNGISLYFAAHAAVASRWDFAIDALQRSYELRRYLVFPDPGTDRSWGPSHFSPRTSAGADAEQWNRGVRHVAAAMFTDEALGRVPQPTAERLQEAADNLVQRLERRNRATTRPSEPWRERHWSSDLPFAYDHYIETLYERRLAVARANPTILQAPFRRQAPFVRTFGNVLLAAKMPDFGVILHAGPIGRQAPRIYGFSGGALSGFWTPETGPVLLGRRSGAQGRAAPDGFHNWQLWPGHATTGTTPNGRVFSTARLRLPTAAMTVHDNDGASVTIEGQLRNGDGAMPDTLANPIAYRRRFELNADHLSIATELDTGTQTAVAELYEILPVFYGPSRGRRPETVRAIRLRVGETWLEADIEPRTATAVRIERHEGAIEIALDRPRPVRLSPEMWADRFQSSVRCRNLMIDLLDRDGEAVPIGRATIEYTIAPLRTPEEHNDGD